MYSYLKDKIVYLYETFHGSETIVLARFNTAAGCLATGLLLLDPNSFGLDPRWVTGWTAANGVLAEYLRRRNASYDDDGSIK
jgi:hypothetical protein